MELILLLLGLCTTLLGTSQAQLVYPDEYERMRTSTIPPYAYSMRPQFDTSLEQSMTNVGGRNVNEVRPIAPQRPNEIIGSGQSSYQIPPAQLPDAANNNQQSYPSGPQPGSIQPPAASQSFESHAPSATVSDSWRTQTYETIYKGVMKFALDMNKAIYNAGLGDTGVSGHRENVIFSPLNLATTMAMVMLGSSGSTFNEIFKALGLDAGQVDLKKDSEIYHRTFGYLLSSMDRKYAGDVGSQLNYASGVFVQTGYPIRPLYLAVVKNSYRGESINLDFEMNGKEARDTINAWVRENTMGKIADLLTEEPHPATTVILASALYFKGEWNQYFINSATKRRPFFIEPKQSFNVDMMYNIGEFPFYEDSQLGAKILELPYKGLDYSMYILLPKQEGATALRNFENRLTVDILERLIGNLRNQTCILGLPRMKLSKSLSLSTALKSVGINTMFARGSADFSILSPTRDEVSTQSSAMPMTNRPSVSTPTRGVVTQPGDASSNSKPGTDMFIFPRFDGEDPPKPTELASRNYFKYQDKIRGYTVEQWATGFSIQKIRLARDEATNSNRLRRRTDVEDDEVDSVDDEEEVAKRMKRQTNEIFQADIRNYLSAQNYTALGLDELRSVPHGNPGLFADEVLHRVEIEINEKGTEAAAASGVLLDRNGNQKRLMANRPFLFFIRHNPSRLLLFWGSINTPTPNYSTA